MDLETTRPQTCNNIWNVLSVDLGSLLSHSVNLLLRKCGRVDFSVDEWITEVTRPIDEWVKFLNKTPVSPN